MTDARSAAAGSGWVASVISTAFTPPAGPAIAASAVSYTAGTITKVGTATYTANDPGNLTGVVRRGHRDRDHRGQLRHLEPDDQRDRSGRHGRRRLLRHDHPLSCLRGRTSAAACPRSRRCALTALALIDRRSLRPTNASARAAAAGSIGLRLLDVPVTAANDPRAQIYIVDHLAPGTVIHRRIEVSNTTRSTAHVVLYAAAATIENGSFLGAAGHTPNDLSTWTSVDPAARSTSPPAGSAMAR